MRPEFRYVPEVIEAHAFSSALAGARKMRPVAYEDFDGDDGWSVEVGLRAALSPNFEGFVGLGYTDSSDFSGEAHLALQGQYKFNRNWGIVADAKLAEDGRLFFIGPRFSF